jgi:hypothetical protein
MLADIGDRIDVPQLGDVPAFLRKAAYGTSLHPNTPIVIRMPHMLKR